MFNEITFPIPDELRYREIFLCLEVLVAFFCFESFIFFFRRYTTRKSKNKSYKEKESLKKADIYDQFQHYLKILKNRELSWGILFFLFGLMELNFILGDFFSADATTRSLFRLSGTLEYAFALVIFAYSLEINELNDTKFLYTKIFGSLTMILLIIVIAIPEISSIFSLIFFFLALIMLFQFSRVIVHRSIGLKKYAIPSYGLFIGYFLFMLGYIASEDFVMEMLGWEIRFLGDSFQIIAVIFLGLSFYFLPSTNEFDWIDKIRSIYVIHPNGLSLFNHEFRFKPEIDSDLTTCGIVAIKSLICEISSKKKGELSSILKEDFSLLIETGRNIISVIIADEDSLVLRKKNRSFCEEFEKKFKNTLENWNGDVRQFSKASKLVDDIFKFK